MNINSFKTILAVNFSIMLLMGITVFMGNQGEVVAQPEITIDPQQPEIEEEEVDLPEGVVIQVDDETVTEEEFESEVDQMIQQQVQMFEMQGEELPEEQIEQMRNQAEGQVAQRMVEQLVLLNGARDAGVEITEEEAEQFLDEQFDSEQEREMALQQLGISQEEAEEEMRNMLMIQEFMEKEIGEIDISEQEARQYFEQNRQQFEEQEQVRARHILKEDDAEAGELEAIKEDLEAGEGDFARLAEEHSDGPSAERGGDLGFFGRDEMVEPFAEEAFDMVPGEIRGPVQTQFGHHLIKVEEVQDGEEVGFEDVRIEVEQQLQQQRQQEKAQQTVEELREEAEIKTDPSIQMPQAQPRPGQQPAPQP